MSAFPTITSEVWACAWNDAHVNALDEAEPVDVIHRPWHYISTGHLIKSNEEGVTLGMDKGEDGKYRTRTFIPRLMVVAEWKVGPLHPPQRRRKRTSLPPVAVEHPNTP